MGDFYTEKQIEEYLQNESRVLILPDGTKRSVTVNRLTWELLESLIGLELFKNEEELIQRVFDWYKEDGRYDFTEYFWNYIAYCYSMVKNPATGQRP